MSSTFYGLQIAKTGIYVSQKGLEVTGHNIANANTEGYTRQRLVTSSIEGNMNYGMFKYTAKGQVGGGVDIEELTQIRDAFLDMQYRRESSTLGEWTVKTDALQYIESVFREPSDAGINVVLADFFDDIQELTKNPESKEIRTLVRQDAIKLTETIKHYYNQLVSLQQEQDEAIKLTVDEINDIVKNIRDLNDQIFKYESGGERANDLRDKRNLLVDQLSTLIKVDYYESSTGRFRIDINGMPLVDHLSYNLLDVEKNSSNPIAGGANLYFVKWEGTDIYLNSDDIRGGELKGYLDMRDGNTADNMGIPYFVEQLNNFAKAIVQGFNDVHKNGFSLPYTSSDGTAVESHDGIDFFTHKAGEPADVNKVTANNITISQEILDSVYNIAAAAEKVDEDDDPNTWGDNGNALALNELRNRNDIPLIQNYEDFAKKVVADLAVEASHSNKMKEGQEILTYNLETRRTSVSGVSIDEEMTNMVQYQHAYSAAARVITAIDETLDILINRTGVVGR